MNYRNKLGTFTFDDCVQDSHMKLIVQNVTGQYLTPKKGEPELTDEQSCYDFIMERCGNVLAGVGFDLEIHENVRVWTKEQLVAKKIREFDQRVKEAAEKASMEALNRLLDEEDLVRPAYGGWLVGPAAVK